MLLSTVGLDRVVNFCSVVRRIRWDFNDTLAYKFAFKSLGRREWTKALAIQRHDQVVYWTTAKIGDGGVLRGFETRGREPAKLRETSAEVFGQTHTCGPVQVKESLRTIPSIYSWIKYVFPSY